MTYQSQKWSHDHNIVDKLIRKGLSNKDIVDQIGVSQQTIAKRRKQLAIRSPLTQKYDRELIKSLIEEGKSNHEIIDLVGCGSATISQMRKKIGIKDPKRKGVNQEWYRYELEEIVKSQQHSEREISEMLNCSEHTVWRVKTEMGLINKNIRQSRTF